MILLACLWISAESPQTDLPEVPKTLVKLESGGHLGEVRGLAFVDDRHLASVGADGTLRCWDRMTGQALVLRFQAGLGRRGGLNALAVRPDGLAAVGEAVGTKRVASVYLVQLPEGRLIRRISAHEVGVNSVSFSPDGTRLATGGADGTLGIWQVSDGRRIAGVSVAAPDAKTAQCLRVAFSPNGKSIGFSQVSRGLKLGDVCGIGTVDAAQPESKPNWMREVPRAGDIPIAWLDDRRFAVASGTHVWFATGGGGDLREVPGSRLASVLSMTTFSDGTLSMAGIASGGKEGGIEILDASGAQKSGLRLPGFVRTVATRGKDWAAGHLLGGITMQTATGIARYGNTSGGVPALAWKTARRFSWSQSKGAASFDLDTAELRIDAESLVATPFQSPNARLQGGRLIVDGSYPVALQDDQVYAASPLDDRRFLVSSARFGLFVLLRFPDGTWRPHQDLLGHETPVLSMATSPDGRYLATVGADSVVRLYPVADLAENSEAPPSAAKALLTLYRRDDGEWVAWNDERQFYCGSPQAGDMVLIQRNEGAEKLATTFRASQDEKRYFRPEFIRESLDGAKVPDAARSQPPLAESVVQAPQIEVVDVRGAERRSDGRWVAQAKVVYPVVRVQNAADTALLKVLVNSPVQSRGSLTDIGKPVGPNMRELQARLIPGSNTVTVLLRSQDRASQEARIEIDFETGDRPAETLHVLPIGIGRYANPRIRKLDYTGDDVNGIADHFRDRRFWPTQGVVVHPSLIDEKATGAGILAAIAELRKAVREQDRVIVFIASHGEAGKEGDFYLVPFEADPDRIKETCLNWQTVIEELQGVNCRSLVLLADNCFSGGISTATDVASSAKKTNARSALSLAKQQMFAVLSASGPDQESYEDAEWKHGAFTKAVLEGLRGELGTKKPGREIPLVVLYGQVFERVRELARGKGAIQDPYLTAPPDAGGVVLSKVGQ